jgi:hypothetical protein
VGNDLFDDYYAFTSSGGSSGDGGSGGGGSGPGCLEFVICGVLGFLLAAVITYELFGGIQALFWILWLPCSIVIYKWLKEISFL